jgi:5'-nucleotidase
LRILLTNDDGVSADGINAAYLGLAAAGHDVIVCAPAEQRSGSSHAVTLRKTMTVKRAALLSGAEAHAVSGSPADACRLGLSLFNHPPIELVISGVNNDTNLAYDINYSGTVGAALEAACAGYPALAVSVGNELPPDWEKVGEVTAAAVSAYPGWKIPREVVLNINIPPEIKVPGFKWVKPHEATPYDFLETVRIDEDTLECVRYRRKDDHLEPRETDVWHYTQGRVTVSPIVPVGVSPDTLQRLSGKDPGPPSGG